MRWICLLFLLTPAVAQSYQLEVFINNQIVPWKLTDGTLDGSSSRTIITFEGGKLGLNLKDWNTFDYAHVLATTFTRSAIDTYSVSATVRHHDTGWDNYANAFEIKGQVQNGLRILLHPHENEQPFTRNQSGVMAQGLVWVEAKDNLEGLGGSTIFLDLSHPSMSIQDSISIRYSLK